MQESNQDFGFQYLQYIEEIIEEYLISIKNINSNYLILNGCSIKELLGKRIFNQPLHDEPLRELFSSYWMNGKIKEGLKETFYNRAFDKFLFNKEEILEVYSKKNSEFEYKSVAESFEKELDSYKGKIVFYAYNKRFLDQVLPILENLEEDVVVLTSFEFPESSNYPQRINILEFSAIKIEQECNEFLKLKFPIFYYLYNTLELIINILKPSPIIVMEGGSIIAYEMLALIGAKYNIKSICLQHGWPCIIHTGFREMPFDYHLCWGEGFKNLFEPVNPKPKFITTGYPFQISNFKVAKKNAISFFFQAPFFVATIPVIEQMIDFAVFCANSFPNLDILIREHPANQFRNEKMKKLKGFKNVKFTPASGTSLNDVLVRSIVSIAIFSSTLMESLAYNSIPFIFNLTSMPHYHPNLDQQKLGIEVKTLNEAKEKIVGLLESNSKLEEFRRNISNKQSEYFEHSGNKAIQNTVNEIQKISKKQ